MSFKSGLGVFQSHFVSVQHDAVCRYIITTTSSALWRFVELRQIVTSHEIQRMSVFIFWSSSMESTLTAH